MTDFADGPLPAMLEAAVRERIVPGAALALGVHGHVVGRLVVGVAELFPDHGVPLTADTLFDLASLTKVMATAPAVLALHDRGDLSLDDPLSRHLDGFGTNGREDIRLHHLLTHTAGLLGSRRFYLSCRTPAELRTAVVTEPLVGAPGGQVVYSDLGFLLLGWVVEAVTGLPLEKACATLLYEPLGLARTTYRPADRLPGVLVAATSEPGVDAVPGSPHDRNARLAGGTAGHAGLFSTVGDVARYAAWWAGPEEGPVSPATRTQAMRCGTPGPGGRRGLGWVTRGDAADFLDETWSPAAVTHTGFTGTSLAIDPERGWWLCLLTAAVHLGRDRPEVADLRARAHRMAAGVLRASDGTG
jgi:CubicO group peptidase (beta-lactamase class C family)